MTVRQASVSSPWGDIASAIKRRGNGRLQLLIDRLQPAFLLQIGDGVRSEQRMRRCRHRPPCVLAGSKQSASAAKLEKHPAFTSASCSSRSRQLLGRQKNTRGIPSSLEISDCGVFGHTDRLPRRPGRSPAFNEILVTVSRRRAVSKKDGEIDTALFQPGFQQRDLDLRAPVIALADSAREGDGKAC